MSKPHDSRTAAKPILVESITADIVHTELHNPFVTSRGTATTARAVVITLKLSDGREAWGESVPVAYVTGETADTVVEAVSQATPLLVGQDVTRRQPLLDSISQSAPNAPSARCGLEMAVLDAWAQATNGSLWQLWGGARTEYDSDVTIPIVPNAGELAELAYALGVNVFKIKVGDSSLEEDFARVAAVRQAAPEARLRLDANQAFTPDDAIRFVSRLLDEGAIIELLEQPVSADDFAGLAEVARRSPVPVFADESCRTPQDALRLASETPVQGFNCKINKSGIVGVLDIIAIARAADRKLMLGCMLETRRAIAVSLVLACGTGAFDFLDLDSHLLLAEDGPNPFFHQEGARMTLPVSA